MGMAGTAIWQQIHGNNMGMVICNKIGNGEEIGMGIDCMEMGGNVVFLLLLANIN